MFWVWHYWRSFFEKMEADLIDAYWQAEYEAVSRAMESHDDAP
jgi:hypothetical protein